MVGWSQIPNECHRIPSRRLRKGELVYGALVNSKSRRSQYKSVPFKVADRYRWIVVLSSRQHMEELRKAPSDQLSFTDEMNEVSTSGELSSAEQTLISIDRRFR